ncbi:MAG: SOS response-associated peptidase, partial [Thermomicrobiales bacterium]
MCGRWDMEITDAEAVARFDIDYVVDRLTPNYNVAPETEMPIIIESEEGKRVLQAFQWGLKREWWEKGKPDPINARSEAIASSRMFGPLLRRQRCLIPASGYSEWVLEGSAKQPYRIRPTDQSAFAFAGLYYSWKRGDEEIATYTIITTSPAKSIASIHDRMPVILHPDDEQLWLARDVQEPDAVLPLLRAYESDALEAYKV